MQALFRNSSATPVNIATWQIDQDEMSVFRYNLVRAGADYELPPSETGEFIIADERADRIGKFRYTAAIDGRHTWVDEVGYDLTWWAGGETPCIFELSKPRG
jgi:hypothetical protein